MAIRKSLVVALALQQLTGCGGGGNGSDPALPGQNANPAPEPTGDAAPSSLRGTSARDLAPLGYKLGTGLADLLGDGYAELALSRVAQFSPGAEERFACTNGGTTALTWSDNDRSDALSNRDEVSVSYANCDGGRGALDGTATLVLVETPASAKARTRADFTGKLSRAGLAFEGRVAVVDDVASAGRLKFSTSNVAFGTGSGAIDFAGYALTAQNLSFETGTGAAATPYDYSYQFTVYVFDRGSNILTSGAEFSAERSDAFKGTTGNHPAVGELNVMTLWDDAVTAAMASVAPDPAYVILTLDPTFFQRGDETTQVLSWNAFLG